jgi:DNA polymerase (family 10)
MTQTNLAIARLFGEIAERLAIQRANPYRVRAYRRAAEALAVLTEDIGAVAERGDLEKIPRIGRDLSEQIREFLATGTIVARDRWATSLPPEVVAWAKLPGLSETTVHHLYARLGIRTLEDLETLAASHLLRTLPGFAGSEQALLDAIQRERGSDASPGPV